MQTITTHLSRFKRSNRGISTVITVMLSLVLIVIIVGNVFISESQMNQADWERKQESIRIVDAEATTENWTQHPSGYALGGSTSLLSGDIANLTADDGSYMTFRSYFSGTDLSDFVDSNSSNVDSLPNEGTQSNFTAQRYGPDAVYDALTEKNTGSNSSSFGSSTSSTYTTISASYMYGSVFTSPADAEGATVQNITWYGRGNFGSGNSKALLVLASTRELLAVSNPVAFSTTAQERTNAFSSPPTISANTAYILMMIFDVSTRFYYGSGSLNQGYYDTSNSYATPTNPTDAANNNNQYRIRAAYEMPENYELDIEVQWTSVDYDETNEVLAIYADQETNTHSLDANGGYMTVGGSADWGSVTGTISFWIKWDAVGGRPWGQHDNMETRISGTYLVLDWGGSDTLTSGTSFTSGNWYFIAIVWDENTDDLYLYVGDQTNPPALDASDGAWSLAVSTAGVTENDFMASKGGVEPANGHGDDLRYWNTDRSLANIQSDYDTEVTGSEANLRSYFKLNNNFDDAGPNNNDGSGSGSYSFQADTPFGGSAETIRVDVWTGSSWQNVFTDLADGWNNVSISSYLSSQTFTIRFKGGVETSDTPQDSWNIDAAILHVWSNEYTSEVEFTGSANTENWSQLNWTANTAWTVGSISVTIQLYNFTLGGYQPSGDGYLAYTSSSTPNVDESKNQTIPADATDFRNATGHWRIKIRGIKITPLFDFKADWIEFAEIKQSGTLITFENDGPLTIHLVSVWVNNPASHQRYETDLILESGGTLSHLFEDIVLLGEEWIIKASTERGNIAIFSNG